MRQITLSQVIQPVCKVIFCTLLFIQTAPFLSGQDDCPPLTVFCQDLHTSFNLGACEVEVWAKDFIPKINDGSQPLDSFYHLF